MAKGLLESWTLLVKPRKWLLMRKQHQLLCHTGIRLPGAVNDEIQPRDLLCVDVVIDEGRIKSNEQPVLVLKCEVT